MSIKSDIRRRRIPQFCYLHLDFCILKLAIGQFESIYRSTLVENLLQISLFLCKTNPNSKMPKLTHTLFYKGLMRIFAPFGHQKTNPKRTQTKPNSERPKMNITSVKTRDYENKLVFEHQKNEAKTKPILAKGKNERKLSLQKGLWKWFTLRAKKTNPISKRRRRLARDAFYWLAEPNLSSLWFVWLNGRWEQLWQRKSLAAWKIYL